MGTVVDGLFEEGVDFLDVFGHVDGYCIFDATVAGTEFGVESDLNASRGTLPATVGMFMMLQNFYLRAWLLWRSWEMRRRDIFLSSD